MNELLEREINRLNAIQSAWMALSSDASESEKDSVISDMKTLPTSYITGRNNKHNIMLNTCTPLFAESLSLAEIKEHAEKYGIRTDISWNCSGSWIAI